MKRNGVIHKFCMLFAVSFCITVIFWGIVFQLVEIYYPPLIGG